MEINQHPHEKLTDEELHVEVEELLKTTTLRVTTDAVEALNHSNDIFAYVATPSLPNGEYDHKYVNIIVGELIKQGITDKNLIIGCTTMPQYCNSIQEKLSDQRNFSLSNSFCRASISCARLLGCKPSTYSRLVGLLGSSTKSWPP